MLKLVMRFLNRSTLFLKVWVFEAELRIKTFSRYSTFKIALKRSPNLVN